MGSLVVTSVASVPVPHAKDEKVRKAVFSPEADYLGVILQDAPARLIDVKSADEIPLPYKHRVSSMAFRRIVPEPPGKEARSREVAIAAGDSHDNYVRRFDLRQRLWLPPLFMPRAAVVAYSWDGLYLAAGSREGLVCVWQLAAEPTAVLCKPLVKSRITGLAFSALKDRLFVVDAAGAALRLRLPDGASGPCLRAKKDNSVLNWDCYCVDAHPTTILVAFGGDTHRARVANTATGFVHNIETGLGRYIHEVKFLANNRQLCLVGETGVEVWNLHPREQALVSTREPPQERTLTAEMRGETLYVARI